MISGNVEGTNLNEEDDDNDGNSFGEALSKMIDNTEASVTRGGKTWSKVVQEIAREMSKGNFSGAFGAAESTLESKGAAGLPGRLCGILLVIVVLIVCWISELILGRILDRQNQSLSVAEDAESSQSRLFLHGLSFARYLMAWHVVLNHFAFGGESSQVTSGEGEPWAVFCRWGALAAPWFYMLSGFANSYSKLVSAPEKRDRQDDFIHAMVKKVLTWYPFYMVALIWCAIRVATVDAEDWAHFTAHGMTIGGWIWGEDETFPYLTGEMWLSWLVVYLLTWAPVHSALAESSDASQDSIIFTIHFMSFAITIPSVILEWIWFFNFPPYLMIQLWPSFCFGQATAFWFVKTCMEIKEIRVGPGSVVTRPTFVRKDVTEIPLLVRFGATITMLFFGIMFFTFSPYDKVPLIGKPVLPWFQKGFQLPVQGLMIVGFAAEVDPIAKLFARRPFRFAEKLTLTTFIFQGPIHYAVEDLTGETGMHFYFVVSLIVFSVAIHYLIERPYRQWLGERERGETWKEESESIKQT
jgi:hypothetical protein